MQWGAMGAHLSGYWGGINDSANRPQCSHWYYLLHKERTRWQWWGHRLVCAVQKTQTWSESDVLLFVAIKTANKLYSKYLTKQKNVCSLRQIGGSLCNQREPWVKGCHTLCPPACVGMMFLLWNAVLSLHQMYQDPCLPSSTSDSLVHRTLCQKALGSLMCFWQMCNRPLCSSWLAVVFALQLSHEYHITSSLSHGGIMNTDINWGKRGLWFLRCSSEFFCDFLDESLFW